MPILSRAQRVVVLQVGATAAESGVLLVVFAALSFGDKTAPGTGGNIGAHLLTMAREAGVDLLVIGSYDHGP